MMATSNGKSAASPEIVLEPATAVLKSKRRRISASEKLRILKAIDDAVPGMQGAVLRREGIYSSQLSTWRRQFERGDFEAANLHKREQRKGQAKAASRRILELERENRKLRRRVSAPN